VLNATGPAVDAVCRLAGDAGGPHLQPTKGVHLVAPPRGLTAAFLLLHPADGRVFFVIPWMGGSKPKTLVGTTDTHFREGVDTLDVTPEEIRYLLEGYNRYFRPPLEPGDVLGTFAGLRPLIRARPGEPSALSREFKVFTSPSGLLSVAGGKYTTYRRMAEVIAAEAASRLGRRHRSCTGDYRLDGAPEGPWARFEPAAVADLQERYGLGDESARHLVRRYGRHAADVGAYLADPSLAARVVPEEPDLLAEFAYQRRQEMALYPEDHLLRRTRLGLFRPDLLRTPPPVIQG
jgi:glycerol-3-phosphate dehydrogenase